jgi:4'-phosphopantetheinyl transferase EntD
MSISPVISDRSRKRADAYAAGSPPRHAPSRALRDLFPEDVATAWGDLRDPTTPLFPEEEAHVARAIDKRRVEFAKGRELARAALVCLGLPPVALLPGPQRNPLWPDQVVGSISHSQELCGAAVARSEDYLGLGVDAELVRPLSPGVVQRICSTEEAGMFSALSEDARAVAPLLVFSAKESIYKCLFPLVRTFFGFDAVHVTLGSGAFHALARDSSLTELVARIRGRFRLTAEYAVTSAWVER